MKKINLKDKKLRLIILLPMIFIVQFYLFKFNIIEPMVKGISIDIVEGDYVKDIDKFTMKLNDTVTLSSGDYIVFPSYASEPKIWFNVLDTEEILKIEGDKVISLKEGISSIALMKDDRVLKKINIRVLDPKVKVLEASLDNDIKYVGEFANIESSIEVDYDRFEEKETINYNVSDDSILKVEEDKLLAIGVGNASFSVTSKDKEQVFAFNIKARIEEIYVNNDLNLTVSDEIKLNTQVITSPRDLDYDTVTYHLVDNKLPIERSVSIDSNGNVVALRIGSEKIMIKCQEKTKYITINVEEKPIKDLEIKNMEVLYNDLGDKLRFEVKFDALKDVYDYELYINKNLTNFELFETINIESDIGRVSYTFELDREEIKNLSIYIVGKNSIETSKSSQIIDMEFDEVIPEKLIENEKVNNLYKKLRETTLTLYWNKIDIENTTYSIYIKDNSVENSGFILYESGIKDTGYSIELDLDEYNLDIYVVGKHKDKNSIQSDTIKIYKMPIIDTEDNLVEDGLEETLPEFEEDLDEEILPEFEEDLEEEVTPEDDDLEEEILPDENITPEEELKNEILHN
ncbi:MAG: hypothetical protein R3Y64_08180 [Peptostreptococcaceae bacterium]